MIKQVCTFYEDTYNMKSYKEFLEGKLIVHSEYDVNNNKIYFESNYSDEDKFWYKRKFDATTINECGEILMYEDSNGKLKHIRHHGRITTKIENSFISKLKYDESNVFYEVIQINVSEDSYGLFELRATTVTYSRRPKLFKLSNVDVSTLRDVPQTSYPLVKSNCARNVPSCPLTPQISALIGLIQSPRCNPTRITKICLAFRRTNGSISEK